MTPVTLNQGYDDVMLGQSYRIPIGAEVME
jgi:hypothetical protein